MANGIGQEIFGPNVPSATLTEQEQLRKLDLAINKLEEQRSLLSSARRGNKEAARKLGLQEDESPTSFETRKQARQFAEDIDRQINLLTQQRKEREVATRQRVRAESLAKIRELPAADEKLIAAVQTNQDLVRQQLAQLPQRLKQTTDPNEAVELARQGLTLATALDVAENPTLIDPKVNIGGGPNLKAARSTILPAVAERLEASGVSVSGQQAGTDVFGPDEPVPGQSQFFTPGQAPEGFSRQPVQTQLGQANQLVAPQGRQLAFTGGGDQIQAGTVPQGLAQPGEAGSGFQGFQVQPELTRRLQPFQEGPAQAVAPQLQMPQEPIGPPAPPPFVGPPAPQFAQPGGFNVPNISGLLSPTPEDRARADAAMAAGRPFAPAPAFVRQGVDAVSQGFSGAFGGLRQQAQQAPEAQGPEPGAFPVQVIDLATGKEGTLFVLPGERIDPTRFRIIQ